MKKIFAFLTAVFVLTGCICFVGCGQTSASDDIEKPPSTQTPNDPNEPERPDLPQSVYYTLTLIYGNGAENGRIVVEEGHTPDIPAEPEFGPHKFLGWYSEGEPYDWTTPVMRDIEITALWEKAYGGEMHTVYGSFETVDGAYRSRTANSLMVNEEDGFDRGTIEVSVTAGTASDNGIVLCLTGNGTNTFWESDVSYYLFFLSRDGTAYLGKVDHGKWLALKVVALSDYDVSQTYVLKTVLNGTDISCYVDGKLYIRYSERAFLTGTGYGLRAGAAGVVFSDFKISGECYQMSA